MTWDLIEVLGYWRDVRMDGTIESFPSAKEKFVIMMRRRTNLLVEHEKKRAAIEA